MKVFECQVCGNALHFESTACVSCGSAVAYVPRRAALSVVKPAGTALTALADPDIAYAACANAVHGVCNWLVPADSEDGFCEACALNRTVPDLGVAGNALRWARLEGAKHHLIYGLSRLGLPFTSGTGPGGRTEPALAFDFLADIKDERGMVRTVMTGHADGIITLNIAEADDAERERRRVALDEPYRTLLGHLRHEVGHYYWARLVAGSSELPAFRRLFGDERADYGASLATYHATGAPADWQDRHISAYATAHPWEDFAETFAHYLHIVDGLETAASFGLTLRPRLSEPDQLATAMLVDPYASHDIKPLLEAWAPLTVAVNSINRSLGQPDLYPFVLSQPVAEKLTFVHGLAHRHAHHRHAHHRPAPLHATR